MKFDAKRYFKGSLLGWGIILLFFGLMSFCYKEDFFRGSSFYSWKHFATYIGIIFLLTRNLWSAAIAFIIAALINFGIVVSTFKTYSDLAIPALLIFAGIILVIYKINKR